MCVRDRVESSRVESGRAGAHFDASIKSHRTIEHVWAPPGLEGDHDRETTELERGRIGESGEGPESGRGGACATTTTTTMPGRVTIGDSSSAESRGVDGRTDDDKWWVMTECVRD